MKEQYAKKSYPPIAESDGISFVVITLMECWKWIITPVENSIRPVVLGQKNFLFCGSHDAAQRTAIIYSLLGSCKMHGIDPHAWLKDVLTSLPTHLSIKSKNYPHPTESQSMLQSKFK